MEVVGKNAPKFVRKNVAMLSRSLGCCVVLGLFCWPSFTETTLMIEQQMRVMVSSLKSYIFTNEKPQTTTSTTAKSEVVNKSEVPEKFIESYSSDIYPRLAQARAALSEQATLDGNKVWLSCITRDSDDVVVLALDKQQLRKRGDEIAVMIKDTPATVVVDESNGVNTKVTIKSAQHWLPFMLAYPIDRGGLRIAYYTPAHYQLRSAQLVADGKAYINNQIVNAKAELTKDGYPIGATACEMAAKLSVVEHVDHSRFINEPQDKLFEEIYTLYALNRGETYRYSVSVAGAGGMIQMIPSTYRLVRQRFPNAELGDDFVNAMTTHSEAMKAMLLYLGMTYDYFQGNSIVSQAMSGAQARVNDLMAAGYNSNPARIPSYIASHNENWTTVIPRETKVYLSILRTLEDPTNPQVEMAREYLQTPLPQYHAKLVNSVSRNSRYKTQMVAIKSSRKAYHSSYHAR